MIGAIGTAPRECAIDSGVPEAHGGNLDCTLIRPGATSFCPSTCPARCWRSAIFTPRWVTANRLRRTRGQWVGHPAHRSGQARDPTAAAGRYGRGGGHDLLRPDLDEAAQLAVSAMVQWLAGATALGINDAAMLISLAGDLRICQVVDPLMTCRLELPKRS